MVVLRRKRSWSQLKSNADNHRYDSNFVVADCRHDVLLEMPWHKQARPKIDYMERFFIVEDMELPTAAGRDNSVVLSGLRVKKFQSLVRSKGNRGEFQVFQVFLKSAAGQNDNVSHDPEMQDLLSQLREVFRDLLPLGLPPKPSVDNAIEKDEGIKPLLRPLYQLSPAELLAVK